MRCKTVDDMISAEVGFTPMELSQAGFFASAIAEAAADSKQFTPADLKPVPGMTAAKLERNGFSANDVRAAGYSLDQMACGGWLLDGAQASGNMDVAPRAADGFAESDEKEM